MQAPRPIFRLTALGLAAAFALAGCSSTEDVPPDTGSVFGGATDACEGVFMLLNGEVASIGEAAGEIASADTNAAIASAMDERFLTLADNVAAIKAELLTPDGRRARSPDELDRGAVIAEIEAAARECVRLERLGLLG